MRSQGLNNSVSTLKSKSAKFGGMLKSMVGSVTRSTSEIRPKRLWNERVDDDYIGSLECIQEIHSNQADIPNIPRRSVIPNSRFTKIDSPRVRPEVPKYEIVDEIPVEGSEKVADVRDEALTPETGIPKTYLEIPESEITELPNYLEIPESEIVDMEPSQDEAETEEMFTPVSSASEADVLPSEFEVPGTSETEFVSLMEEVDYFDFLPPMKVSEKQKHEETDPINVTIDTDSLKAPRNPFNVTIDMDSLESASIYLEMAIPEAAVPPFNVFIDMRSFETPRNPINVVIDRESFEIPVSPFNVTIDTESLKTVAPYVPNFVLVEEKVSELNMFTEDILRTFDEEDSHIVPQAEGIDHMSEITEVKTEAKTELKVDNEEPKAEQKEGITFSFFSNQNDDSMIGISFGVQDDDCEDAETEGTVSIRDDYAVTASSADKSGNMYL